MNTPLVSIIITTKNEAKNIENCLISIQEQSYSNIETIVVDNASTDKTKEIARQYTDKVYDKGPERSAQRNYGMIDIAQGKYVMFIDADMSIEKNLIAECVNSFTTQPDLAGVFIPLRWIGNNWIIKAKGFEREFYDATCLDAVRFIPKKLVEQIKGFDERMYACEDWDFDKRIRALGKTATVSALMYHHEDENINLSEYLDNINYYTKNVDIYLNKWGKNEPDIKKQFGLYYRYFGVFIEQGKWKKLLRHPILAFGMYWLRFLVGVKYIMRSKG